MLHAAVIAVTLFASPHSPLRTFPLVALGKVAVKDGWSRPRATIEGRVTAVRRERDGDIHIVVVDPQDRKVICEIVPELPMPNGLPKVGMTVQVSGIVRWDLGHGHGELHPVIKWRVK